MNEEANSAKELAEQLLYKVPHVLDAEPVVKDAAWAFCEEYRGFMNRAKTEREFVTQAVALLQQAGYQGYRPGIRYAPGQKVYWVNRQKALLATTFGSRPLSEGVRINAAHIDSPRLDLKPNPLYEKEELAGLKTHYYGGIRKYQWTTIPLALHGVFVRTNGEVVPVCIGEDENDPVFTISDLLPHLSKKQDSRTLADGVRAEELNIIVGSLPYPDEDAKNRVKLYTMQLLHEKYGVTERDFLCAELTAVPAFPARDIGFDRSMIGAYGHDDRVCAYTALRAEMGVKAPQYTTVLCLADKEEIGSQGNTGLNADYLLHYLTYLAEGQGADVKGVLAASKCLSADVSAALDPTFDDVFEPHNAARLNHGVVVMKYTGARGKSDASDASAETMAFVAGLLDASSVVWQAGELGKVDAGGGGTVAKYVAQHNVDVVDIGVPLLSMHAPYEIAAKLDIYMCYRAFCVFAE